MRKVVVAALLGILLTAGAAFAQAPSFNITAPGDGTFVRRGSSVTVRWTHSAYYNAHAGQNAIPYCQPAGATGPVVQIANPVPVVNDQFEWTAGRKSDGTWLLPGSYEITMESLDFDDTTGPNIFLYVFDFKPPFLQRRLELIKVVDVPMSFSFDPKWIEMEMDGLDAVRIELAQNGRKLADLGRFGKGGATAGPVNLAGVKSADGFELVVYAPNGKMLLKQAINVALPAK